MWKYTGTKECNDFLLSLHLFDCKDKKKYIKTLYSISNNVEANYRKFKIKKRSESYRTIYEPSPLLKYIQKQILCNILNNKSISNYAKAYKKGISLKENALPHTNKKKILKLDIKNFFDNISFYSVYQSCFPIEYFPKSVGILLTYLCTYKDHLIQGAPTSAYISNLVMKEFDENIGGWCKEKNISYTRYSDDLTFSGDFTPKEIIKKVRNELFKLGLELNQKKTHVIYRQNKQCVTGLVVNEKVEVSTSYRKEIRKEMYYIKKFGLLSHLEKSKCSIPPEKYVRSLYGKINYVLQISQENKEFQNYKNFLSVYKK